MTRENARAESLRAWLTQNRTLTQGDWFLQALAVANVQHTLLARDLVPDSGPGAIPELTRLVMDLEQPHLRALAGRMLRVTTGQDHGTVFPLMPEAQRVAICERYRLIFESARAAAGR